jgi:hypothetical protein
MIKEIKQERQKTSGARARLFIVKEAWVQKGQYPQAQADA